MKDCCIVTGGAGFIGCAISQGLTERFERAMVFDCLHPQIHKACKRPALLHQNVELYQADVRDEKMWDSLLAGLSAVDTVIDLAAETGTAQSLLSATRHTSTNVVGTSQLMDALVRADKLPRQILLASSRAVYGEGAWRKADGTEFYPGQRTNEQLAAARWDFPDAVYLSADAAVTVPHPTSVYGATKLCQENLLSAWGGATGVNIKILRLQNVYGPGQSLINAYTGIVSLFVRQAKAGKTIQLYEDGEIIRDFVLIDDVRDAILAALDQDQAIGRVIDIGTGKRTTIAQIARLIARRYGAPEPAVCGKYRNGDVRCGACDADRAKALLGFTAQYDLEAGVNRLCDWIDREWDGVEEE